MDQKGPLPTVNGKCNGPGHVLADTAVLRALLTLSYIATTVMSTMYSNSLPQLTFI